MSDITLCLGLDAKTIEQFIVSSPTWHKFHPELWGWPWFVFYDPAQITQQQVTSAVMRLSCPAQLHTEPWNPPVSYASQREKMLSGWVYGPPAHVTTPWFMKLDADAIAVRACKDWIDSSWFASDQNGWHNVWIASSWPYSKAKGGRGDIYDWARWLEEAGDQLWPDTPRLGLAEHISGSKIKYPRMASWFSFYRAGWARLAAGWAATVSGYGSLPVPSQDTWHWYCATRHNDRRLSVRKLGKRRGLTNVPSLDRLKARVAEVMEN